MGPTNVSLVKLFQADQQLRAARERLDAAAKNVRVQERRVNDLATKLKAAQAHHKELQAKAGNLDLDLLGFRTRPSAMLLAAFNGGPVGARPVEQPVIVVLPFKDVNAASGTEYFVEGLTDEIIRNLATVHGLQVRSHASSFAFKDKPDNYRQIATQLGVNLVVDGSVQRDGNRLRVSAQLVQVEGDILLWADRFDLERKAIFSTQDEISRAIVNRLGLTISERPRRPLNDPDVYELYLQARTLVDRRGIPNALKAAELFRRVIAADPRFAPAHAGLANAYAFASFPFRGIEFEAAYPIMRAAALEALRLDPLLAEAHMAMGWVYSYEHHWMNAERSFQRSLQLDPSLTQAYTSYSISTLQPLEKYDQALRLLQEALRHDPLSLDVQREIGQVQLYSGRYAEAVDTFQRTVQINPEFPFVRSFLARALILTDRVDEALQLLDPGMPFVGLGRAYVLTGRRAEAERLAAEWERYPYRLAITSAALGDTERAVAALERAAVSEPHRMGRLLNEPELATLRRDPRVAAIRKKFGLPLTATRPRS
jgi:TolB-like protein/Flp pilus assembly protein TadD